MQRKGVKRFMPHLISAIPGCLGSNKGFHCPPSRCAYAQAQAFFQCLSQQCNIKANMLPNANPSVSMRHNLVSTEALALHYRLQLDMLVLSCPLKFVLQLQQPHADSCLQIMK